MDKDPKIGTGLLIAPEDKRDLSHSIVFGSVAPEKLPDGEFFVGEPAEIKNQDINYNSDFCAGYAGAEAAEDQDIGVKYVPEYTWAAARDLAKLPVESYGLDLRQICMAGIKVGFLSREYDPFNCDNENRRERDFLADFKNWPADLAMLAADGRKNSFFAVDGPNDRFDNMRSVMFKNKAERRSIITGVAWRSSWSDAPQGIIPATGWENDRGSGHAIKIFGWMPIKDPETGVEELMLVAQLSNGPDFGDKGLFYFRRSVINSEFVFGSYTFKDMPADYARYHQDYNMRADLNPLVKLLKVLWVLIKSGFGFRGN